MIQLASWWWNHLPHPPGSLTYRGSQPMFLNQKGALTVPNPSRTDLRSACTLPPYQGSGIGVPIHASPSEGCQWPPDSCCLFPSGSSPSSERRTALQGLDLRLEKQIRTLHHILIFHPPECMLLPPITEGSGGVTLINIHPWGEIVTVGALGVVTVFILHIHNHTSHVVVYRFYKEVGSAWHPPPPLQPSTGHATYSSIFSKETQYAHRAADSCGASTHTEFIYIRLSKIKLSSVNQTMFSLALILNTKTYYNSCLGYITFHMTCIVLNLTYNISREQYFTRDNSLRMA